MTFDPNKARDFVYRCGTLFERALFAWLFDGFSLERLHQIMLCYKNPDNGFGHGFEHDLKAPVSNPLALEYMLSLMRHCGIPPGKLLDGVAHWLEAQLDSDGNLRNPPAIRQYPLAPWWQDWGGQTMPDSIVAQLHYFGAATPGLIEKTKTWAMERHTLERIHANDWLFMAYHAYDFFFTFDDLPDLERYRGAVLENIVACALAMPENQYSSIFAFAPTPDSQVARRLPAGVIERGLNALVHGQQENGAWIDQHDLPQWHPIATINALLALRRYGKW